PCGEPLPLLPRQGDDELLVRGLRVRSRRRRGLRGLGVLAHAAVDKAAPKRPREHGEDGGDEDEIGSLFHFSNGVCVTSSSAPSAACSSASASSREMRVGARSTSALT